ncbi:hypothetical protein GHNINEIG_01815 [Hydrogenovibrio crunogenus]|uniref:Uncharacterized protein n=1 Tax=Hydrogenovibrio crunogenus TaxID=39765 RepID=A0A4P7P0X1_9GAMM|nr:hypothetical protein [Hydrogenovibrio crunogenus]QBZ83753.1 hypothetical protein GHNINEIG_01815 [Hydrogenovibrio crunogenus]
MSLSVREKQKGSISLMGVMAMVASFSAFYLVMEMGNKMIEDRNFTNYAKSLAPIALRTELAITREMVKEGTAKTSQDVVSEYLSQLGLKAGSSFSFKLTFGNMEPSGNGEQDVFNALPQNAERPKMSTATGEDPPVFSAIKVVLENKGGLLDFHPKGIAVYGLSSDSRDSGNVASCYCDVRYEACLLQEPGTDSGAMGNIGSDQRKSYCETGYAPVKKKFTMFPPFIVESAKYSSVNLSPQWVGKAYKNQETGTATDETTTAWQRVQASKPVEISNGVNVFPLASWNAATTRWTTPAETLIGKTSSFSSSSVNGSFYIGRSATCAHPSGGWFFFNMFSSMMDWFSGGGTDDCLVYTGDLNYKRDYPTVMKAFLDMVASSTGSNEYLYSCRDFVGIREARGGFIQWFTRLWTSPFVDWTQSYGETGCVSRKMRWFGPESFGN